MGRPKKIIKAKEPIRPRERKLANGNWGLYLAMNEVDADFCRGFLRFLSSARNSVCTVNARSISHGCAHHHQAVFNGALNKAVRSVILQTNPMKCSL